MGGGDMLKKVQPGDAMRIPAGAYNAFIETAQARKDSSLEFRRTPRLSGPTAGTVLAVNGSGEDAPQHGACKLQSPGLLDYEPPAWVQFTKPDGAPGVSYGGRYNYGITLEPIPDGEVGRIAVAGGPWPLQMPVPWSASIGAGLGPQDGEWTVVTTEGMQQWTVVRPMKDNLVLVRFGIVRLPEVWEVTAVNELVSYVTVQAVADTGGGLSPESEVSVPYFSDEDTPELGDRGTITRTWEGALVFFPRRLDKVLPQVYVPDEARLLVHINLPGTAETKIGNWGRYIVAPPPDGGWETRYAAYGVWKFGTRIRLGANRSAIVWSDDIGKLEVEGLGRRIHYGNGTVKFGVILEDFDIDTLTGSEFGALDKGLTEWSFSTGYGSTAWESYRVDGQRRLFCHRQPGSAPPNVLVYGVCCYISTPFLGYGDGGERYHHEIDVAGGLGSRHVQLAVVTASDEVR